MFIVGDANTDATNILKASDVDQSDKVAAERDAKEVNAELATKSFDSIRAISKQTKDPTRKKQIMYIIRVIG